MTQALRYRNTLWQTQNYKVEITSLSMWLAQFGYIQKIYLDYSDTQYAKLHEQCFFHIPNDVIMWLGHHDMSAAIYTSSTYIMLYSTIVFVFLFLRSLFHRWFPRSGQFYHTYGITFTTLLYVFLNGLNIFYKHKIQIIISEFERKTQICGAFINKPSFWCGNEVNKVRWSKFIQR